MAETSSIRYGIQRVVRRISRFHRARRGVAAVEFAMIAPFMIAIWVGSIELSQAVTADRKVSHASSALADLVTQQANLTGEEMEDIMDATQAIMMPFDVGNLSIEIAGISIDNNSDTTIEWSAARNGEAPAIGGTYEIPPTLLIPDSFLVVANLSYSHNPPTAEVIIGAIELTDDFFLRPRRSEAITFTP